MSGRILLGQIGKLEKISQGGQGVVYRAPSATTNFAKSMVYKEYKKPTLASLDVKALDSLPAFLEDLPYRDGAKLISLAAWPCRIVEDAGSVTGFLMPSIPDEFYIELWTNKSTPSRVTAEFQHLLNDPQVLAMRFRGSVPTDRQRYELIQQVASALAFLHERDVCVGDISPKNILYALSPAPAVYFIDCDAMRVRGTSLSPQVETPGWGVPPGEEKATIYSDRYKLGLLALRILVGNQDTQDPARLPASVPTALRRVVTETLKGKPTERPAFSAWDSALIPAIASASNQQPKVPYKPPTQKNPSLQHPSIPPVAPKARQSQRQQAPAPPLVTPASVLVSQRTPTNAAPWLWVLVGLIGVAIIGAAVFNSRSGGSSGSSPTYGATASPTYRAPSAVPSSEATSTGDLGLSVPMSTPPCDGRGIVILSSITTPGRYAEGVSRALAQFPGSSYLRTDMACSSLKPRYNGNPIYAVYRPGGRTREELCSAVAAAGNGAYGKWLDNTTDDDFIVCAS